MSEERRIVSASRVVDAPPEVLFELIADPSRQPSWDGNENLATAEPGQRVRAVGDVFTMTLTGGQVRQNHVVEFDEGRRIAWRPSEVDADPPGHLWRWELEPRDDDSTLVTHTYDWTQLTDESRFRRARATLPDNLMASLDGLADAVQQDRMDLRPCSPASRWPTTPRPRSGTHACSDSRRRSTRTTRRRSGRSPPGGPSTSRTDRSTRATRW